VNALLWFVVWWMCATVFVMTYYAWQRKGDGPRLAADLQSAERELVRVRDELSTCQRDKLRAISDCHHEMLYRERDRRALANALDTLSVVREICQDDESELAREVLEAVS